LSLQPSEDFSRKVVLHLAKLREAKGVTMERLAKLSGISRSMISMMESSQRHPTVVTVHALATALGVTMADLVSGVQVSKPRQTKRGI
jgi:transcriptional regulator with XRE-family HTH domain